MTQIEPASPYWLASEEHQQYLEKKQRRQTHSNQPIVSP
ncbi:peptide-methionine (S)-S-oxide reductase [Leptolyngbya sp. ST-U4]